MRTERNEPLRQFTVLGDGLPPPGVPIEWITPAGHLVRGRFAGGRVFYPEGSDLYVYYTPLSWRLVEAT